VRKRRFYLLLIGVAVPVGVLVAVLRPPREPEYNGVKLSEWVDGLGAADSVRPRVAEEAISHIGTDALPYLVKWIQYEPPPSRRALKGVMLFFGYDFSLVGKNGARAERVIDAFRSLGSEACGAIPQLIRLMNDLDRPWGAERAARAIGRMGTNARGTVPTLITLLTNANAGLAIAALGEVKLESQVVVPALTNCLQSSNYVVRFSAAYALGRFGDEARSAVPALAQALGDSDRAVRHWASNAMWQIDPKALERALNRTGGKKSE